MDIPATMQDWWIYLIPGSFVVVEAFFLFDALTHLIQGWVPVFYAGTLIPYIQSYSIVAVLVLGVASLVVGSILEGLSAFFFQRVQNESVIKEQALENAKTSKLFISAMKAANYLPAGVIPAKAEDVTHDEWANVLDYLIPLLYSICNEREVGIAEETDTARTYTQSFFVAFLLSPAFALWFLGRGNPLLSLLTLVADLGMLVYLWRDSKALGRIYYEKVFRITYSHVQSGAKTS